MNEKQKDGIATVFDNVGTACIFTIAGVSYDFIKLGFTDLVLLYILTVILFLLSYFLRVEGRND